MLVGNMSQLITPYQPFTLSKLREGGGMSKLTPSPLPLQTMCYYIPAIVSATIMDIKPMPVITYLTMFNVCWFVVFILS